ncbi:MAG TPA: hypothetical protein VFQ85_05650 [Mycobacteriales bacterium]|jgi:hypothetical protein|nr:hypothetical protein [Mycobacteriales bacterium]
MRIKRLAVAAIAVAALVPGFTTSASADNGPLIGSICGFTSTNDETGVVNQDPAHQYGELHMGPLLLGSLGSLFPLTVPPAVPPTVPTLPPTPPQLAKSGTLRCWIQTSPEYDYTNAPNNEANTYPYGYLSLGPLSGLEVQCNNGVCAGGGAIEYDAAVTADVYLCISVTDIDGVATNDWLWDDDYYAPEDGDLVPWNSTSHPVCGLAISAG